MARKRDWSRLTRKEAGLRSARNDKYDRWRLDRAGQAYEKTATNVVKAEWAYRKIQRNEKPSPAERNRKRSYRQRNVMETAILQCKTLAQLKAWWRANQGALKAMRATYPHHFATVDAAKDWRKAELSR